MIGARDMAFPRFNAFTYWTFLFSGVLLYIAPFLGQAPHAGWFAYVPYTDSHYSPAYGMDFYNAGAASCLTISTTGGRHQLHRHHPAPARARHEHQQDAACSSTAR